MPTYTYYCKKCKTDTDIVHSIKDESKKKCPTCKKVMLRRLNWQGKVLSTGLKPTREDYKESEHTKKVKDFDRAVKKRKKLFGRDAVGDPPGKADPRHIIKRGKTLGGQQKEVDRAEFIKAAAKDERTVASAMQALRKQKP